MSIDMNTFLAPAYRIVVDPAETAPKPCTIRYGPVPEELRELLGDENYLSDETFVAKDLNIPYRFTMGMEAVHAGKTRRTAYYLVYVFLGSEDDRPRLSHVVYHWSGLNVDGLKLSHAIGEHPLLSAKIEIAE